MNIPDKWVILKINDNLYKVLAGWSGGYLDGDSWRINSGISKVEETDTYYDFIGESGSIYRCNKSSYGFNGITSNIYAKIKDKVDLLEYQKFGELCLK